MKGASPQPYGEVRGVKSVGRRLVVAADRRCRRSVHEYGGLGNSRWFSFCHRTTSTAQFACCTTRVETLPRRNRAMAPSPLAPITIRSACCLEATFMISSAGFPSRHTGSAVNPALTSFRTLCSINLLACLLQPRVLDRTASHGSRSHESARARPCRSNDPAETWSAQTPVLWPMRPIHRSPR